MSKLKDCEARILRRCTENLLNDCLEFSGAKGKNEGRVWCWDPAKGKSRVMTLIGACVIVNEISIAPGLFPYHTCGNGMCFNRAHIKVGTRAEMVAHHKSIGTYAVTSAKAASRLAARRTWTKVNMQIVREIRSSDEKGTELAKRFGLTTQHISQIKRHKVWRETVGPASIFSMGVCA